MKKLILTFIFLMGLIPGITTHAQRVPTLDFFHGETCPHCHREKEWFPDLQKLYPDLQINEYEVWFNAENNELMKQRLRELGQTSSGVPTNIIETDVVVGFRPDDILAALEKHYGPPQEISADSQTTTPEVDDESWRKYLDKSWPIMSIILGIVDGFNPCAMWTLLILIGFLLGMEDTRKRWLVGSVFVGSSAIIYFLALLAYLLGFESILLFASGNVMGWIFRIVGVLALATGAIALKTSFKKTVDCDVRDAKSKKEFRDKLAEILERDEIYMVLIGVVGLAFSVNMVELLCSFAIPTAFTGTLVSLDLPFYQQIIAIVLYDIMYILDDVLVLVIALWTLNLKIITNNKIIQYSHLIGGILLVLIGLLLIFDPGTLTRLTS